MHWLEIVKTCFEMAFYVFGGFIAVAGLSTWRRQMRGKNRYEIAFDIMAGANRLHDAIESVPSAIMSSAEYAERERDEEESAVDSRLANAYYAYQRRFDRVRDELKSYYDSLVRAKVAFGEEAYAKALGISNLANELGHAIRIYFEMQYAMKDDESWNSMLPRQEYNILYGIDPETGKGINAEKEQGEKLPDSYFDDGGFSKRLETVVPEIEDYFGRYVRNRKWWEFFRN